MPSLPSPRAALARWLHRTVPADVPVPADYVGPACATPNCQTRRAPWGREYETVSHPDGLPTLRCTDCAGELAALHGWKVHA